jgi:hypothetical protein
MLRRIYRNGTFGWYLELAGRKLFGLHIGDTYSGLIFRRPNGYGHDKVGSDGHG